LNIKTDFTQPECEFFRQQCNFTDEERAIFDLRVKDIGIIAIQERMKELGMPMSESTINRRIKSIKRKIYKVI